MKQISIKFRAWDAKKKEWLESVPPDEYMLDSDQWSSPDYGDMEESMFFYPNYPLGPTFKDRIVYQQFSGLKDSKNQEVYEGDIVKFKYDVGDFAWEEMDEEETKRQSKMLNKEFVGVVQRDLLGSINLEVVSGNIYFPLGYVMNATVIGNVLENPDLCEK